MTFDQPVFEKQLPEVFYKKSVLKDLAKFTGKCLCQSLLFNKVADLKFPLIIQESNQKV